MSETKTVDLEVVEPDQKLVQAASQTGLEKSAMSPLLAAFQPIYAKARTALAEAAGVAESVKDATCVTEIRKSRACRLAIRSIRIESEKTRKAQKEHALLYGKAVDGFHNILMADLSPVENALQEAEDVAERAEAARLALLKADREKVLLPLLESPVVTDLSVISQADFEKLVSDAKLLRQAKIEAAAKAEAEAKAKAEAERIERERIAAENARLKAEAEAREAAAKAEREEAVRKLAEERAAAEAARKAAEEKFRKEREEIEAKAREERAAAFAAARKEYERLEAIAAAERAKVAAAEAEAKSLKLAEEKRIADEAEKAAEEKRRAEAAARKAAAAPDNARAKAFAESLRALTVPKFNTKAFDLLPGKIEALAKWIEAQITTGELL